MERQRKGKQFKRLFGSLTIALLLCVTSFGSLTVRATETNVSETVDITIDNSVSHLGVRFYPDTNDMDNFEFVEAGATETYKASKDSVYMFRRTDFMCQTTM